MRKETHMTYEQAFEYVGSFTKSGTPVKDLIRFVILMRLLGNPQNELKIVHVAGTNGKGSVCEYISNAVKADNKSVGKFTSPYIECIEERIQVNGKYISRPAFALLCGQVKKAVEQTGFDGFSQFEILCAIALLYFYKEQVNVAVIETGIGGLLDCTNVVNPAVSVITSVDFDHTDVLGDTLTEIAHHKAGIIKPSVPCIVYPGQAKEVMRVIDDKCREYNCEEIIPDMSRVQMLHMDITDVFFSYKGTNYHLIMSGEHQIKNALCAIEACRILNIEYSSVFTGLERSALRARMEEVSVNGVTCIIDGSHNPSAMRAAEKLLNCDKRKIHAVVGMMANKDWQTALKIILPRFEDVIFVDGFMPGCVPTSQLTRFAIEQGVRATACGDLNSAISQATLKAGTKDIAMVTGSLYLASAAEKIISK